MAVTLQLMTSLARNLQYPAVWRPRFVFFIFPWALTSAPSSLDLSSCILCRLCGLVNQLLDVRVLRLLGQCLI